MLFILIKLVLSRPQLTGLHTALIEVSCCTERISCWDSSSFPAAVATLAVRHLNESRTSFNRLLYLSTSLFHFGIADRKLLLLINSGCSFKHVTKKHVFSEWATPGKANELLVFNTFSLPTEVEQLCLLHFIQPVCLPHSTMHTCCMTAWWPWWISMDHMFTM